ncbi:SprT family zinc-dependent metalloprotease [Alteromonas sp. 345S023]|uniref:SprT family zinc-dependent metalloprotease n=1 Tax=Alteromonas profundi TaxID=2696062 RepID=A0A7X5RLN1_9ALTE|nr:SprT family zinc-dependent metalloprotease [Alteromonas profundi]
MATYDLTSAQRQRIAGRVDVLYQQADAYFNRTFPRPTLSFRRSGKNAGTAFLQQNRINLHPLLYSDNESEYHDDVIPHEISHLLVWQLFGKVKPHGKEWQSIMLGVFKRPPNTTHSFDINAVLGDRFAYQCGCGEHRLSIRRHNKIQKGTKYQCKRCKQVLSPV